MQPLDDLPVSLLGLTPSDVDVARVTNLRVEGALQGCVLGLVVDGGGGSVLQQHPDDALVAPASRDVQRGVALVVLDVQPTRVQVEVHHRLHTLERALGGRA